MSLENDRHHNNCLLLYARYHIKHCVYPLKLASQVIGTDAHFTDVDMGRLSPSDSARSAFHHVNDGWVKR